MEVFPQAGEATRLFAPDAVVQRFGLVLEQRPDHFGGALAASKHLAAGQIERGVVGVIAGNGAQSVFAEAIDQPANSRPVDRPGFMSVAKRHSDMKDVSRVRPIRPK